MSNDYDDTMYSILSMDNAILKHVTRNSGVIWVVVTNIWRVWRRREWKNMSKEGAGVVRCRKIDKLHQSVDYACNKSSQLWEPIHCV